MPSFLRRTASVFLGIVMSYMLYGVTGWIIIAFFVIKDLATFVYLIFGIEFMEQKDALARSVVLKIEISWIILFLGLNGLLLILIRKKFLEIQKGVQIGFAFVLISIFNIVFYENPFQFLPLNEIVAEGSRIVDMEKAVNPTSIEDCLHIDDLDQQSICYGKLALFAKEPAYCQYLKKEGTVRSFFSYNNSIVQTQEQCYSRFAEETGDIAYCRKVANTSMAVDCIVETRHSVWKRMAGAEPAIPDASQKEIDIAICNNAPLSTDLLAPRAECIETVAIYYNNASLCTAFKDNPLWFQYSLCPNNVALAWRNMEGCSLVRDEERQWGCRIGVQSRLNDQALRNR